MSTREIPVRFRVPKKMWRRLRELIPAEPPRVGAGRPRLPARQVADGIFYVLRTGCQWKAAPPEFGSGSSLHRYFQEWVRAGVFLELWKSALHQYDKRKRIRWKWQSMDGAMTKAPLGGGKNREESDGQGQIRHQAFGAHGRQRSSVGFGGKRGEHTRHEVSGRDVECDGSSSSQDKAA
jgi:transposase